MKPLDALRRARDLWSRAWPLWSVRVSALGALLTALAAATPDTLLQIWQGLPDDVRMLLPESVGRIVPTVLFLLTIVVRMIPQAKASEEAEPVVASLTNEVASDLSGIMTSISEAVASNHAQQVNAANALAMRIDCLDARVSAAEAIASVAGASPKLSIDAAGKFTGFHTAGASDARG